jgi:predicted Fe-S protein YdhL (DUF1289 family)
MLTPCINVCKIAPGTNTCAGCFRTLEEISKWTHLTDSQRDAIMRKIKERSNAQDQERANCVSSVCDK